ncbi:hypothetical protein ES703_50700 [subsurface metagenome]
MDIVKIILNAVSPKLRKLFVEFIRSLKVEAEKTSNPLDDIVVEILYGIFNIKD